MTLVREVLSLLGIRPRDLWRPVLSGALALGSAVALAGVSAWLVARASQHPPVVAVSLAVVAVRGLGVSRGVLRYVERLASHGVALRALVGVRERVYAALATGDPDVVARLRRGDLLARWGSDVDGLADVLVRGVLPFPVVALVGGATAVAVALVLPVAGLVLLAAMAASGVLAPWWAARAARRSVEDAALERAEVTDRALAVLDGTAELEVMGALPQALAAVRDTDRRLAARLDAAARPAALAAAAVPLGVGLAVVAGLVLGAAPAATGSLDPLWLAVLVLVPLACAELVAPLPAAAVELVRGRAAVDRVREVLAVPAARGGDGLLPAPRRATLEAVDLVCGREGLAVLPGVSLRVSPGELVVVQGPSGSGKTTLLATLAGLLPPLGGELRLGGTSVDLLDQRSLRHAVSFAAEDAHVFATTLRENLQVAAGGAPDETLVRALDEAGLRSWVDGLPEGLDARLGPDGADISGGERRRLLLARALLTGADVLLLDEPDEHLSDEAADHAWARLRRVAREDGRGVVVVTHRAVPVGVADRVLLLTPPPATSVAGATRSTPSAQPDRWPATS